MELKEFFQRRGFRSSHYKLERDGIAVHEKGILNSRRYHVPYICISPKGEEITSSNGKMMSAAIFFTVLTLICMIVVAFGSKKDSDGWVTYVFWGVPAILCWGAFIWGRISLLIYAQNGGVLALHADNPSREEVSRFVRQLFEARNAFLRSKFGRLSLDQPLAERLAALELLRDQEAITEEEYNRLRKLQSDGLSDRSSSIGFVR
jgi:hypothetical protein